MSGAAYFTAFDNTLAITASRRCASPRTKRRTSARNVRPRTGRCQWRPSHNVDQELTEIEPRRPDPQTIALEQRGVQQVHHHATEVVDASADLFDAFALLDRKRPAQQQRASERDDADRLLQFVRDNGRPLCLHALTLVDDRNVLADHDGAVRRPVLAEDGGGAHQQRHRSIVRAPRDELPSHGHLATGQGPHDRKVVRDQTLARGMRQFDRQRIEARFRRRRVHHRPEGAVLQDHLPPLVDHEDTLRHLIEHRLQPRIRAGIILADPLGFKRAPERTASISAIS